MIWHRVRTVIGREEFDKTIISFSSREEADEFLERLGKISRNSKWDKESYRGYPFIN